jgi:hypothetical protein
MEQPRVPLIAEAQCAHASSKVSAGDYSDDRLLTGLTGDDGKARNASDARSTNDNMSENYIYTDYDEDFESCISEEIQKQKKRGAQQQLPGSGSRGSGDSTDPCDDGGVTRTTITSAEAATPTLTSPNKKFAALSASSSLATGTDLGGSIDVAVRAMSSGALGGSEVEEKDSSHVSRKPSNVGIEPAGDVSDLEDSLC